MQNRMIIRVELRLSCNGLLGKDVLSASDPFVVVKQKDKSGKFYEIGTTERVKNTNDPNFSQGIYIDYLFEEVQTLKFAVYDSDNDTDTTDDDDGLGKVVVKLGEIVSSRETKLKLSKQNSSASKPSTITIVANEVTDINEIQFQVCGTGLDKKDFLGKSDPFLQVCCQNGDKSYVVYQTEVVKDTKKPNWRQFSSRIQNLCNGDFSRPILFKVFDHDSDGSHSLIGEFEAPLKDLVDVDPPPVKDLINPKKKAKKKDYKNSGKLTFNQCKVVRRFSFLDYLFGGCQINFTCGIDFTGSNGDPRHSSSLHYMGSVNPNEYTQAIQAVGYVIQDYDSDKLYPAFGFGAKVPPSNDVSHEFALNFNEQNPYCAGVEGLLGAYCNAIQQVKLWGPTNISPIINHVARFAMQAEQSGLATNYFVLLIITDGVITDMNETRQAVVNASSLPMSIIIVGVGNADFTAMEFLDSDKVPLKSPDGRMAARDIVQFVPFRQFKMMSSGALASSVLSEIPNQVVGYFSMKNIPPSGSIVQQNNSLPKST